MLMPYALYELNKSLWAPALPWLQAAADFFQIPDDAPFAQPARRFAAGCDLLVRLCKRYTKPAFGLSETVVDGKRVDVTETLALALPFCRLLHFERATACRLDRSCLRPLRHFLGAGLARCHLPATARLDVSVRHVRAAYIVIGIGIDARSRRTLGARASARGMCRHFGITRR